MATGSREILARALEIIGNTTPIAADCGLLCEQRCCRIEDAGMLLLPGEADLLGDEPGYEYVEDDGETILVCSGSCRRDKRPFACRIFPLFPVVTETDDGDKISLIYDPRSYAICPLAIAHFPLRAVFRYLVRRATRVLLKDPELRVWLLAQSEDVSELEEARIIIGK